MHKLTNDRRKWGWGAFLAGSLLLAFVLLVRPCVWIRLPRARVSFDGRRTSLAAVYRSCDGQLLILIKEAWGEMPYVVRPEGHVLLANWGSLLDDNPEANHSWVTAPFTLILEKHPEHGILMGSMEDGIDGHEVVQPHRVEFAEEYPTSGKPAWKTRRVRVPL